jgi:hypothetical protein
MELRVLEHEEGIWADMREQSALRASAREPIRSGPMDDSPSSSSTVAFELDGVRDIVVIASSSRSGSTLVAEILRRSASYLHISGEINPFLRMAGLVWPRSGTDSDALVFESAAPAALARLRAELAREIRIAQRESELAFLEDDFLERLHRRLSMQWPLESISFDVVREAAEYSVRRLPLDSSAADSCVMHFHLKFLLHLRRHVPAVNPYYYDVDRTLLQGIAPEIAVPRGAPSPMIIEEPPFVLIAPSRRPRADDLAERTLVIKTPSNAYRLDFIRKLFPNARLRILHLMRNPAAAINGLIDGWNHWGFHSHRIGEQLCIENYVPARPEDRSWWKFDLPPGWRDYCNARLEEVCAFQWSAAHEAIDDYVQESGVACLRLRFEDLLIGFNRNSTQFAELCEWLGNDSIPPGLPQSFPTTMATHPPQPRRWTQRADILAPVLALPQTRRCIERLGYADQSCWI